MLLLTAAAAAAAAAMASSGGNNSAFQPGQIWLDSSGNAIRAHSAGLLPPVKAGEAFVWYGADNYTSGDGTNVWINAYRSVDLLNWDYMGHVYTHPGPIKCPDAGTPPAVGVACGEADRPKAIRHPTTGDVVLIVKSSPGVSFATAPTEAGPFKFSKTIYPNGNWAGDINVFVDPKVPTDAYLMYSLRPGGPDNAFRGSDAAVRGSNVGGGGAANGAATDDRYIMIAKLTPDWLDVEPEPVGHIAEQREAPAAWYTPGVGYFIWTSHVTGWSANPAAVYFAESMATQNWTSLGNPTDDSTSFQSQSTYILPVNGSYIYVADRFEPYVGQKTAPRYVWLPITNISATGLTVDWHDQWNL